MTPPLFSTRSRKALPLRAFCFWARSRVARLRSPLAPGYPNLRKNVKRRGPQEPRRSVLKKWRRRLGGSAFGQPGVVQRRKELRLQAKSTTCPAGKTGFKALTKVSPSFLQVVLCFLANAEGFAPAGATRGLSDRPLDSFGPHTCETSASSGTENSFSQRSCEKYRFFSRLQPAKPEGTKKIGGTAIPPMAHQFLERLRLSLGARYTPSGTGENSTSRGVGVTSSSGMGEGVGVGSKVGCAVGVPVNGKISTACSQF